MSIKLSDHFIGVAAKRLSRVEIYSNQHEFNGINKFKDILGSERRNFSGRVIYFSDIEEQVIDNATNFTWYDVRENNPNRSAEYRLYYSDNEIVPNSSIGDLVVLCRDVKDQIIIIVAASGTTAEQQLIQLFGLNEIENKFVVKDFRDDYSELGFVGKYVLEFLGIEIVPEQETDYLEIMLGSFGKNFPTTEVFSAFARSTVQDINVLDDPDQALIAWWDREGDLLRIFERAIVGERIKEGFGDDVEAFIQFALSVINRRKSRAGHSLESHLKTIFDVHNISYSKGAKTERNNKPDFIFPSIDAYKDETYPIDQLYMLGVKTTAKDRWRQVLSEADRVTRKHLITLEPAISKNQTDEMFAQNLQLVIPNSLHSTYMESQRNEIINLNSFIQLL